MCRLGEGVNPHLASAPFFGYVMCACRQADGEPRVLAAYRQIVNPGFTDPFDPVRDITLDNPKYACRALGLHLMTGKLDWLLLRNMQVGR